MKKKLLIILTLILFTPFVVNAYEIKIDWQKNWGGNENDYLTKAISTGDGNIVAVGYYYSKTIANLTNTGEESDAIIIKYDNNGNILWQTSFSGNKMDTYKDVIEASDGGYVVVGHTKSTDLEGIEYVGNMSAIIIKYDKDGNILWKNNYGKTKNEHFYRVIETSDGGYVAYDYTYETYDNQKGLIVKYDNNGQELWDKKIGGNKSESIINVIATEDNGIAVFVESESDEVEGINNKGITDLILMKYDKDGNLVWKNSWGGSDEDCFHNVIKTKEGYAAIGYSLSSDIDNFKNEPDYYPAVIVLFDEEGNVIKQKSWYHKNYKYILNGFTKIIQTKDDGFAVSGYITDFVCEEVCNPLLVKFDKNLNVVWEILYDDSFGEEIKKIIPMSNNEIIVFKNRSENNRKSQIIEYDDKGNMLSEYEYHGTLKDVLITKNPGFVVLLQSSNYYNSTIPVDNKTDAEIIKWSFKYNLENIITENGTAVVEQKGKNGIITPTPNEGYEVSEIVIKDKNGNVLDLEVTKLEDGTYSFPINDDVTVEVLFKEKLENPKTGMSNIIGLMFTIALCFISGFFVLKNYNKNYEL